MRAVLANPGQYVRRINTATIGYITAQFFETPNKIDIQWNGPNGWYETGVSLSELVACDVHGDQIGYLIWPHGEPRTADGEPETAPPVREDGSVVSGSPEVTESSPDHGSQIHDVPDWEAMRTGVPKDPKDWEPELLKGESIIWDGGSINREDSQNYTMPPKAEDSDLVRWWVAKARNEIEPIAAKISEYGGDGRAIDLFEIGRTMNESGIVHPIDADEDDDSWQAELGIYFYLVGKFARWKAAIQEGRKVSDDTLLDIGIYIRMAQRIRDVGGWPK